ncbi:MAG: hypothetical protein ETSY1_37255 [Candidatus Entotheonella factor]|uniref:Uncharacterized protein n=1 Tax=Entotheonella factor TaxID=1429438 RepID=W4L890_ENTF1|nr:MAG: hypothetical protein ETSY1_37255 [Candidatus Entotheonella factor]
MSDKSVLMGRESKGLNKHWGTPQVWGAPYLGGMGWDD